MRNRAATNSSDNQSNKKFQQALNYKKSGDLRSAIECFNQCKPSFNVLLELGNCYRLIGKYEDALSNYNVALQEVENGRTFQEELVHDNICKTYTTWYYRTKDEKILQLFKEAIDNHPIQSSCNVQLFLAKYYFYCEQIPKAKEKIQELKRKYPGDLDLNIELVSLNLLINTFLELEFTEEDAKDVLKVAHISKQNASFLLRVAESFPHLIDLDKIEIKPGKSIKGQIAAAEIHAIYNSNLGAKHYEKLLERFPDDWKVRRSYAHVLEKTGDLQGAIDVLESFSKTNKKLDDFQRLNNDRFLAHVYYSLGNKEKAKDYIQLGFKIDPEDASLKSLQAKLNPQNSTASYRNFEISRKDKERTERLHPARKELKSKVGIEPELASSTIKKIEVEKKHSPIGSVLAISQKNANILNKNKKTTAAKMNVEKKNACLYDDSPYEFDLGTSNEKVNDTGTLADALTTTATKEKKIISKKNKPVPKQSMKKNVVSKSPAADNTPLASAPLENKREEIKSVILPEVQRQPTSLCAKFSLFALGIAVTSTSVYIASTQFKPND